MIHVLVLFIASAQIWGDAILINSQLLCSKSDSHGKTIGRHHDSQCGLLVRCDLHGTLKTKIFFSCKNDKNYYYNFMKPKSSILYKDKKIYYSTLTKESSSKKISEVIFSPTFDGKDEVLLTTDKGYYHFIEEKNGPELYLLIPGSCTKSSFKVPGFEDCFSAKENVKLPK